MKQLYLLLLLCLAVSCQNKKYDPQTYGKTVDTEKSGSGEETLRDQLRVFMNYCDANRTADLKLFSRDWTRTWKDWKTEGVTDLGNVSYCHMEHKQRYTDDHRSFHFSVHADDTPPIFEADCSFFETEYSDLVSAICEEFGSPDEEKEGRDGTIYIWHVSDTKTLRTALDHWSCDFIIYYQL